MKRFLAGSIAALACMTGGLFWWQSHASQDRQPVYAQDRPADAPPALPVGDPLKSGAAPPDLPAGDPRSREQKRFDRYDRNRDGIIMRVEMMSTRTAAFKKLDKDGDNLLSFEEWAIKTGERFASADANRDGRLTPPEFATTAPKPSAKPRCDCSDD